MMWLKMNEKIELERPLSNIRVMAKKTLEEFDLAYIYWERWNKKTEQWEYTSSPPMVFIRLDSIAKIYKEWCQ